MKHLLFFLVFLIASVFIKAQENFASWVQFLDGDHNNTNMNNIATDGENLYVNGSYTLNATFFGNELPEDLSTNALLAKLDKSGNLLWYNTIAGDGFDSFYDIATDSEGNIIASGWFGSKTDIKLNGEVIIPADDIWNIKSIVAKFSKTNGSLIWLKTWSSEEFTTANALKLSIDKNDNIYVGGYYSSDFSVDGVNISFNKTMGEDVFCIKFDSAGNAQWGKTFETEANGGFSRTKSLTVNENGVFYAFEYNQAVKIGNDSVPHIGGGYSLAVVKMGFDGAVQGYTNFGSTSGYQTINQMISDKNNNIIMGGYFSNNTGFSIQGTQPTGYGSDDGFVAKLDSDLQLKWIKTMGGEYLDRVFNLFTNNTGDLFAGGGFDSFTDFNYDGQKVIDKRTPNSLAMFQLHLDESGNFKEALAFHGYDSATTLSNNGAVVLSDGKVFSVGRIVGKAYFEQGGELVDTMEHALGFVMEWDTPFSTLATNESFTEKMYVYPNPFENIINISLKNKDNITVNIYDFSGKNVYSSSSVKDNKINLSHLKSGIYLMKIQTPDASHTVKLIKR